MSSGTQTLYLEFINPAHPGSSAEGPLRSPGAPGERDVAGRRLAQEGHPPPNLPLVREVQSGAHLLLKRCGGLRPLPAPSNSQLRD